MLRFRRNPPQSLRNAGDGLPPCGLEPTTLDCGSRWPRCPSVVVRLSFIASRTAGREVRNQRTLRAACLTRPAPSGSGHRPRVARTVGLSMASPGWVLQGCRAVQVSGCPPLGPLRVQATSPVPSLGRWLRYGCGRAPEWPVRPDQRPSRRAAAGCSARRRGFGWGLRGDPSTNLRQATGSAAHSEREPSIRMRCPLPTDWLQSGRTVRVRVASGGEQPVPLSVSARDGKPVFDLIDQGCGAPVVGGIGTAQNDIERRDCVTHRRFQRVHDLALPVGWD